MGLKNVEGVKKMSKSGQNLGKLGTTSAFVALPLMLLWACSDLKGTVRKCEQTGTCGAKQAAKDNDQGATEKPSASLNQSEKAALFGAELKLLEAWNAKLCEKVNETRVKCPAAYPLIPNKSGNVLACNPSAGGATIEGKFSLKANANHNGRSIPISLWANDGKFTTNAVSGGGHNSIEWKQANMSASMVPRLVDLVSMKLRDQEGVTAGSFTFDKIQDFELQLNGKTILTRNDLTDSADGGVAVKAQKLTELKNNSGCKIEEGLTDSLREKAKAEVEGLNPKDLSKGLSDSEASAAIPNLEGALERERGRQRGLFAALGIDPNLGCWQDVGLKSMVIIVDGNPGGNNGAIKLDENAGSPRQGEGDASSYTFQLSDIFKFNDSNSPQRTIFKPEGKITKTDFTGGGMKIGDTQFIKIKKNGYSFESSSSKDCNNGFLGIGASCSTKFVNTETNVTFLSRIRILANDQLIYDRDGINHTFKQGSLEFSDTDFKNNKAWRSLLSRTDCQISAGAK